MRAAAEVATGRTARDRRIPHVSVSVRWWGSGRLLVIGCALLQAGVDGAEDHLGDQADDDEVDEHLDGDQCAGEVALGGDIAEPDGGEHGDGEVHGVDLVHGWVKLSAWPARSGSTR